MCGGTFVRAPQHLRALRTPDVSVAIAFLFTSIEGICQGCLEYSPIEGQGRRGDTEELISFPLNTVLPVPTPNSPEFLRLWTTEWTLGKESLNLEFEN